MGILEVDTIEQVEMKEKIKKEYLRRTRLSIFSQEVNFTRSVLAAIAQLQQDFTFSSISLSIFSQKT